MPRPANCLVQHDIPNPRGIVPLLRPDVQNPGEAVVPFDDEMQPISPAEALADIRLLARIEIVAAALVERFGEGALDQPPTDLKPAAGALDDEHGRADEAGANLDQARDVAFGHGADVGNGHVGCSVCGFKGGQVGEKH